jgi:hypothetical protein
MTKPAKPARFRKPSVNSKKPNKTNPLRDFNFFSSQLLTLTVLQQVLEKPDLNEFTKEVVFNAMLVTTTTLDKIAADHPDFEKQADFIISQFGTEVKDEQETI